MPIEGWLRMIGGGFVAAGLLLGIFVHPFSGSRFSWVRTCFSRRLRSRAR